MIVSNERDGRMIGSYEVESRMSFLRSEVDGLGIRIDRDSGVFGGFLQWGLFVVADSQLVDVGFLIHRDVIHPSRDRRHVDVVERRVTTGDQEMVGQVTNVILDVFRIEKTVVQWMWDHLVDEVQFETNGISDDPVGVSV